MKELIKILLLSVISVFAITSCSNDEDLDAQDIEETLPVWMTSDGHFDVDLYNASVMDSAWRQLDINERDAALNIPEEVLPTLSSNELLYACSVHPAFLTYVYFDDPAIALVHLIMNKYNGFNELLKRSNYREVIAEFVMNNSYLKDFNNRNGDDFKEYYRAAGILLFLDNQNFIEGMDKSVAKRLLENCLEYQSSGYLYNIPLVYIDKYKEDGTPRTYFYVIDSVVNRLTEYLNGQE